MTYTLHPASMDAQATVKLGGTSPVTIQTTSHGEEMLVRTNGCLRGRAMTCRATFGNYWLLISSREEGGSSSEVRFSRRVILVASNTPSSYRLYNRAALLLDIMYLVPSRSGNTRLLEKLGLGPSVAAALAPQPRIPVGLPYQLSRRFQHNANPTSDLQEVVIPRNSFRRFIS